MSEYQDNQPEENHENEITEEIIFHQDTIKPMNIDEAGLKKLKEGHEIILEEENKAYFLKFKPLGNNLKILLSEQDNFPAKTYEIYLALEELKLKNKMFLIYNTTKELTDELNKNDTRINFIINKKQGNIISLTIIFPCEDKNIDNDIEIDLTENIIDNREMFRQLFEKYKSIQQEQEEDFTQFMNRIKNIEEILASQSKEPVIENNEMKEEDQQKNIEEQEQKPEIKNGEENNEEHKEIEPEALDAKSSNIESISSIQKGKNVKKGKLEKKKEDKGKIIKKKKK